jgi:DNA-binding response OmpR family regulator
MSTILVIEDDPSIQLGLKDNLEYESYSVLTANDAESGHRMIREHQPDLIILDVMLPGMNGFELCRRLRNEGVGMPILMLTARSDEIDRVMGLDLGADDYVTKPFSVMEVMARVRALLRRSQTKPALPEEVSFGDVDVSFTKYEATRAGESVNLARKEFGVLQVLAARPGEVVTRDELLDEVWGEDEYPGSRTVDNHIAMLRSKLEDNPRDPRHLLTMHGVGYKLVL